MKGFLMLVFLCFFLSVFLLPLFLLAWCLISHILNGVEIFSFTSAKKESGLYRHNTEMQNVIFDQVFVEKKVPNILHSSLSHLYSDFKTYFLILQFLKNTGDFSHFCGLTGLTCVVK